MNVILYLQNCNLNNIFENRTVTTDNSKYSCSHQIVWLLLLNSDDDDDDGDDDDGDDDDFIYIDVDDDNSLEGIIN